MPRSLARMISSTAPTRTTSGRALLAVLALAALLFAVPLDWGLEAVDGMAPDEIGRRHVDEAIASHFSGGWWNVYPPVNFYLLAAAREGAAALVRPDDGLPAFRVRMLAGRLLACGFALTTVFLLWLTGRELGLGAGAPVAALLWAASPSVAYYAKTANAESFYLLFVALALWAIVRYARRPGLARLVAAGLASATAVATKDQAAVLLLAALGIAVVRAARREAAAPAPAARAVTKRLAEALLVAVVAVLWLALLFGAFWNRVGVERHFQRIESLPANPAQRAHEASLAGRTEQAIAMGGTLVFVLGVPGAALAALGLARLAGSAELRRRALAPLAGAAAHLVFFWLTVPRSYDRLLLPAALVGALFAGAGAEWLLGRWRTRGRAVRWLLAVALAFSAARAAELDLRLLFDSRRLVGDWIRRDGGGVESTWVVGREPWSSAAGFPVASGTPAYFRHQLDRYRPAHLIVEAGQLESAQWRDTYERAGYRVVHRTSGPIPSCISDPRHPARSNLDKVSPELAVLRREP